MAWTSWKELVIDFELEPMQFQNMVQISSLFVVYVVIIFILENEVWK